MTASEERMAKIVAGSTWIDADPRGLAHGKNVTKRQFPEGTRRVITVISVNGGLALVKVTHQIPDGTEVLARRIKTMTLRHMAHHFKPAPAATTLAAADGPTSINVTAPADATPLPGDTTSRVPASEIFSPEVIDHARQAFGIDTQDDGIEMSPSHSVTSEAVPEGEDAAVDVPVTTEI